MKGGVYAYRCRKPGARLRIPILSWHWCYVGETNSFYHRHQQHVYGLGRYSAPAKPWSDLSPYVAFRIPLPNWVWLRRTVETLVILALWPVYNVQKNRWNPRRIKPSDAHRHRVLRERGGQVLYTPTTRLLPWFILAAAVAAWLYIGGWVR